MPRSDVLGAPNLEAGWKSQGGVILIDFVLRYNEATVQVYKVKWERGLEGSLRIDGQKWRE